MERVPVLVHVQQHFLHTVPADLPQVLRLALDGQRRKRRKRFLEPPHGVFIALPHQRVEQRLLAVVIAVHRTGRYTRRLDDVSQGGVLKTLFQKLRLCRQQNLFPRTA